MLQLNRVVQTGVSITFTATLISQRLNKNLYNRTQEINKYYGKQTQNTYAGGRFEGSHIKTSAENMGNFITQTDIGRVIIKMQQPSFAFWSSQM